MILFVMLFTVGTGYFIFVNQNNLLYTQALSNRANSIQNTLAESLLLSTAVNAGGNLAVAITDEGPQTTTLVQILVTSPSGVVTSKVNAPLPLDLNAGATSSSIDSGVSYTSGTYAVKVVTQRGATFSATYPPTATSLAAQALSSGAIGDLYLTFGSYTYYATTSHGSNNNCPSASGGNSGYCLQTSAGNTGQGFFIPGSLGSTPLGWSVTLTDLNPSQDDIILDQFTLLYQTYTSGHVNLNAWFVTSVGAPANSLIPILSKYTPVVLHYDIPVTVYFEAQSCVSASTGPNHPNCPNAGDGSNICAAGIINNVFIISHGWEETPGSYTISGLTYSSTNYGQNTPFVSTLCY